MLAFVAARRFCLGEVNWGYYSLWCMGFSLWWPPLLQSPGFRVTGFRSYRSGIEPVSPALVDRRILTHWTTRKSPVPYSKFFRINLQSTVPILSLTVAPNGTYVCMVSCFSCVWLFVTLWIVAYQALLSMGLSRLVCLVIFSFSKTSLVASFIPSTCCPRTKDYFSFRA